jgi:putative flippase GtrA
VRTPDLKRIAKFGATGLLTTGVAYVVFAGLRALGGHYAVAAAAAWAMSLLVGFAINRRFTFGIAGGDSRVRDFGLYVVGAVLQLLVGEAGYGVFISLLHMGTTWAFLANLPITTSFNFLFLRFVVFRRAAAA